MTVILVGAGPGDKGLMTIKGAERIKNADVVLYDRFVSDEILGMIPENAEKIDVGKNMGSHPVPQDEINRLLLEKGKEGKTVVRLKGGDPFVFGRGGEELELLADNGIQFEVVPGVTSAVAGPAYAGIPVTHREFASSLHIVTGHAKNNEETNIDFEALVRTGGTLVFMMGVSALEEICAGCISAGMDKNMPAAIVENATLPTQRKFIGTVGSLPQAARENGVESPAVIIIGKVCGFSDVYDWFAGKPLLGKSIIVARAKPGVSKLSEGLRELGCRVIEMPGADIAPLTAPGSDLTQSLKKIEDYSWLVFTSSIGAAVFFEYLKEMSIDIRTLSHLKIACVGSETETEIKKYGVFAAYIPPEYNGAALAHGLCGLAEKDERILIARAKDGAEELTSIMSDAGINFDDVAVYEKRRSLAKADVCREAIQTQINNGSCFAAFTSSSSVAWFADSATDWFADSAGGVAFSGIKAICIGERTAGTARSYGMEVFISDDSTINSMLKKIEEVMK